MIAQAAEQAVKLDDAYVCANLTFCSYQITRIESTMHPKRLPVQAGVNHYCEMLMIVEPLVFRPNEQSGG